MTLFTNFNKILSSHGISCKKFDNFITNINNNISICQNIDSLKNSDKSNEFKNFLKMTGISGILGVAGGFVVNRIVTTVGSEVAGGMIGGPPGMVIGGVIGIGSIIGQSFYHFKNNRKIIDKLYEDLKNSVEMSMELSRNNAEDLVKANERIIKEKIEDVIEYMEIIINRAILSKSNY